MTRRTSNSSPGPKARGTHGTGSGKRPASARRGSRVGAEARIRVCIEPKLNYWGEPLPRRIPDRVIQSALLRRAMAADGFLMQALTSMPSRTEQSIRIRTADFRHFQEGDYQMVFRVNLRLYHDPRPRRLCVLVSKGDAVSLRIAATEYRLLRQWSRRRPEQVIAPYASDMIRLPVGSGSGAGRLFVYATPWLDGFHELGVTADLRFFVNEQPLQRFAPAWTDLIKARILALCWSLYDPEKGTMPAPPLIGAGDIMITRPQAGRQPDVRLIAARGVNRVAGLEDCLCQLLAYAGDWGGRRFTLRPADPACLWKAVYDGLVVAHGMSESQVRQALDSVLAGSLPSPS